ncbi:hypothetical protein IWQ62_002136 [Dispira parvispora]|uniref:Uncharacterized protein n=1 Tax=Dispira parvispora TaxID=1520584 RepID=A0A9W8E7T4_9FUNG|nr:hypothetical protein IWQ62_002136 [Dispira parvispora]
MRLVNSESGIWYDSSKGGTKQASPLDHAQVGKPKDPRRTKLDHLRVEYEEVEWSNLSFGKDTITTEVRSVVGHSEDTRNLFALGGLFGIGKSWDYITNPTGIDRTLREIWGLGEDSSLFIHVKLDPGKMHNPRDPYGELLINRQPPVPAKVHGHPLQPPVFTAQLTPLNHMREEVTVFVNGVEVQKVGSIDIRFEASVRFMYFPETTANSINKKLGAKRLFRNFLTRKSSTLFNQLPLQRSNSADRTPNELMEMPALYGNLDQSFKKYTVDIQIRDAKFTFKPDEYIIPSSDVGCSSPEDSKFLVSGFAAAYTQPLNPRTEIVLGELFFRKYLTTFEAKGKVRNVHIPRKPE